MTSTGAECFVDALEQYGVEYVFGNPGTTELPVLKALADSDLEYILGLHEDIAVGMAGGYASTRRYHAHNDDSVLPVGVANLHLAPGLAHGLGNLYAARIAGAPVVVTAGNHSTDFRHEEPILSGDLVGMAEEFTKWSAEVLDVKALPSMVRRAFRVALTPPTGPVFLGLPLNTMMAETDAEPERLGEIPTAGRGDRTQIQRATQLLVEAEEPTMIIGDHVARMGRNAVESAVKLAEAAGLRVHGEILSSEVNFPTEHDQWLSYVPPDEKLAGNLMDVDTLVFAGCSTNTTLVRHENPLVDRETTCIHLGPDAWELGKHQPADAAVLGDPGEVMTELADHVEERLDEGIRVSRIERVADARKSIASILNSTGTGDGSDDPRASKAELVDQLREAAPDAYIVDEGVTSKYALLNRWPLEAEGIISNKGGGLGYGLPAAVGAAIAEDQRETPRNVMGFVGDGSYLYYPHAIHTAARHDVNLSVVVVDNRNYRILKDNTIKLFGGSDADHDYVGMDFEPPVDIPANAESHGAEGRSVETPADIAPTVEDALAEGGPTVIDVLVHD
ncbi:thiamine pyrophosphate-binding protein [Halalkalicoccus subterraneus]|uniref:thiamine pyrophosphate-binding protein n=1 Tax=Halalkalicoccus subterraneus TaxID=2675002 RepID=UPI000EFD29BF|nr:thiamine pyrophosphate-binding protein [Halalkalicoccus subterraneus]